MGATTRNQLPDDQPQAGNTREQSPSVLDLDEFETFCSNTFTTLKDRFFWIFEDMEEAEDLAIKTIDDFVRAVNRGTKIPWQPLVRKIAKDVLNNAHRRNYRQPKMIDLEDISSPYAHGGSLRPTEEAVIDLHDQESLLLVIQELHPLDQAVIALRMLDYEFSEIASMPDIIAKMNKPITEKTIRNRYGKVMSKDLPRLLKARGKA